MVMMTKFSRLFFKVMHWSFCWWCLCNCYLWLFSSIPPMCACSRAKMIIGHYSHVLLHAVKLNETNFVVHFLKPCAVSSNFFKSLSLSLVNVCCNRSMPMSDYLIINKKALFSCEVLKKINLTTFSLFFC